MEKKIQLVLIHIRPKCLRLTLSLYECLLGSNFKDFITHQLIHSRLCQRISSSKKFDIETKLVSPLPNKYCEASFVERLPFELQNLHQHDTNLESPSFLSNQSVFEVHMKVDLNSFGLEMLVELPLHARYLTTNYVPVCLCWSFLYRKLHNQSFVYIPMTDSDGSRIGIAVWRISSVIKCWAMKLELEKF
ncbi:hypothetical protein ACOSP7_003141 [Xanthoceras sorbifolium]